MLADDPVLKRQVALKYLRPDLKLQADERRLLMERMRQEAQAIARVAHSGIVALHDIGSDPDLGTFWSSNWRKVRPWKRSSDAED